MNIKEIQQSEKVVLSPGDVAPVIGCDPQYLRVTARENPEQLGFPVCVIGSRVKIPRLPFLAFIGVKEEKKHER